MHTNEMMSRMDLSGKAGETVRNEKRNRKHGNRLLALAMVMMLAAGTFPGQVLAAQNKTAGSSDNSDAGTESVRLGRDRSAGCR